MCEKVYLISTNYLRKQLPLSIPHHLLVSLPEKLVPYVKERICLARKLLTRHSRRYRLCLPHQGAIS
jgi:hypothetical protein